MVLEDGGIWPEFSKAWIRPQEVEGVGMWLIIPIW